MRYNSDDRLSSRPSQVIHISDLKGLPIQLLYCFSELRILNNHVILSPIHFCTSVDRQRHFLSRSPSAMSREFNVPPIVFQSGQSASVPHQRRAAAAAAAPKFQPPRPGMIPGSNPNLPFMSFDIGAAQPSSSFSTAPVFSGGTFSSGNFDEEAPLLDELGINTRHIWRKTVSILIPFRLRANVHEDADLSGPFLYLMTFGFFQLLAGKFHFGIILGWVTISALFIYVVFNMLAGRSGNLDLYRCLSLVGYCMLPMVIFSAISLFLPRGGVVIFAMGAVFGLWSTKTCTQLLVELSSCGEENRLLIAYACWLVYMLFSLLIIF